MKKKTAIAALMLSALTGTAFADNYETQSFAGPFNTYGSVDFDETNPLNQSVTVTFTNVSASANGILLQMDLTSLEAATWASEVGFLVTPPSGPAFYVFPAFENDATYSSLTDVTVSIAVPASVGNVGQWTFLMWDGFPDGSDDLDIAATIPQSAISNLRISATDVAIDLPVNVTSLGMLNGTDVTTSASDYVGGQIRWYSFEIPADATPASGFYVDLDTVGTSTAPNTGGATAVNDTEMGIYDSRGFFFGSNDDGTDGFESVLTFGSEVERTHGASTGIYDGFDGSLFTGTYYVAVGTFNMAFGDTFDVTSTSTSPGGTLVLNIFSNFPGAPTACSPADLGMAGGVAGQDNALNNNDFIAFISHFFNNDARADLGSAGGVASSDGQWNNNDFIAFISYFFNDQANCTG